MLLLKMTSGVPEKKTNQKFGNLPATAVVPTPLCKKLAPKDRNVAEHGEGRREGRS